MGAPRTFRTEGVVIRYSDIGEADRIVTLLTPHHGKLRALARGIRRARARLAGHLDSCCRSELLLAEGRELPVVASALLVNGYARLRQDLYLTSYALYLLELADRFSEEQLENWPLYQLVVRTLDALEAGAPGELLLRHFELQLLKVSGFLPSLRVCLACQQEIEPGENWFGPQGVTCPACPPDAASRPVSTTALKVMRFLARAELTEAMRLRPTTATLRELEGHLQRAVRIVAERELKSADFLQQVRRQASEGKIVSPASR
jgi:DNA repair protein RecO (recombination protein O)